MFRAPLVLSIGLLALAGCAPAPSHPLAAATPARQCMFPDDVQSFRVVADTKAVLVRTTGNAVFELQAAGDCRDLASAMRLAVADNTTRLCAGDWTMLSVSSATAPCRAQVVKRLSPAEVAALPARDRP